MSDPIDDRSISTLLQNYHRESDALITDRLTPETEEPGTREYDFVTVHELNASFQASHVQDGSEDEDDLYGDLPPAHPSSGLSDFGTGEPGYNSDDLDYSMDPPPSIQEEDDNLYGMDLPQIESDGSYTMDLGSGTGGADEAPGPVGESEAGTNGIFWEHRETKGELRWVRLKRCSRCQAAISLGGGNSLHAATRRN